MFSHTDNLCIEIIKVMYHQCFEAHRLLGRAPFSLPMMAQYDMLHYITEIVRKAVNACNQAITKHNAERYMTEQSSFIRIAEPTFDRQFFHLPDIVQKASRDKQILISFCQSRDPFCHCSKIH